MPATPPSRAYGFVAILDALGAADYDYEQARAFLERLDEVKSSLPLASETKGGLPDTELSRIEWLSLQDTVILVYNCASNAPTVREVRFFSWVLRSCVAGLMERDLPFRGAFAMGEIYSATNGSNKAVLGPAVRDASRWCERVKWAGVIATPRTQLIIKSLNEDEKTLAPYLLRAEAPVKTEKESARQSLLAINWPKGLHLRLPDQNGDGVRARVAKALSHQQMPVGSEENAFHTLTFLDYVISEQHLEESWNRRRQPGAKHPASRKRRRKSPK